MITNIIKKLKSFIDIDTEKKDILNETEEIIERTMDLEEAIKLVQRDMLKNDDISSDQKQRVLSLAMAGDQENIKLAKKLITNILINNKVTITGMNISQASEEIYAKLYGLSVVEKYYQMSTVDEIRVNSTTNIYIVENGISSKANVKFDSEAEIEEVIKRMIMEDQGISLDRSSPIIESVRMDSSRLTATCRPVTKHPTFILRKHDSFVPTVENYIKKETFDMDTWKKLSILARSGCKILFSGNVGAGKTTLLKKTVGELNEKMRIAVIGKDLELQLQEEYQDEKDIIEFEAQELLGIGMKELFYTTLRESPDVLINEEFRGAGEAIEAVRSCTRGLPSAMATAHFNSAEEAIEGTALFMLEEGLNLPLNLAKLRVARAFNIVVQLLGDAVTGKKKLVAITEVIVADETSINFKELVSWNADIEEDYFGKGEWKSAYKPSPGLLKSLIRKVSKDELSEVGWH